MASHEARSSQAASHFEQARIHKMRALTSQGAFIAAAKAFQRTIENDI